MRVYQTKKGKFTTRKAAHAFDLTVLGNEQYVRDGSLLVAKCWGVLNRDTGKLHQVCNTRQEARYANWREGTKVVALG